jgi:hypothetical protein
MNDAMLKAKATDFQCTVVKGGNHFCYYNIMKDQKFWDWLLSKRRASAKPVAVAKPAPPPPGPTLAKIKPEQAEPWDAKLVAKLKETLTKNPGFSYKSPTYKDTAKIKGIDAQGVFSASVGPIEIKTALSKLPFTDRAALAAAVLNPADEESNAMAAFYTLASGDKANGEDFLKKAGAKGAELKTMFFPPVTVASPAPHKDE